MSNPKCIIQAGHINHKNNVLANMRGNTGAPGEQELNKRIADRVSAMLRERGFEVVQTDACANSDRAIITKDYDLFLSLHGDADYAGDSGGGFADYADPASDGNTKESQRITAILNDIYFKETGIVYKNRSNKNTRFYYMWQYLTSKTPCVLIEMGQVQDPHDKVLLGNTTLIASAITRSLCKAFNKPYDLPTTTINLKDEEIKKLKGDLEVANKALEQAKLQYRDDMAGMVTKCQGLENKLKQISEIAKL